jgi:hypothetical protein
MTEPKIPPAFDWNDRLIRFGIYVSVAWAIVAIVVLCVRADWGANGKLAPNNWGDVFAGFFAPLAFLWLVLGFLQQGRELKVQIEELRKTVEHQGQLAEATREMAQDEKTANEAARKASAEALAVSIKANEMQITMERPYVTGGGSYWRQPPMHGNAYVVNHNGERRFRVDVSNYGKTPAYLFAFDVQFESASQVKAALLPVFRTHAHYDLLPPGGAPRNGIDASREFWIPKWAQVVFGAFWYRDIWGEAHMFRFILSLSDPETLSDVDCVDGYRGHWDLDKDLKIVA